ncbi:hypothetical protein ACOSP7_006473 [Xanthoceras sorbifolium]
MVKKGVGLGFQSVRSVYLGRGWHQVTKIQIKCYSLVKSKKKNGAAWVLSGREEMAMQRYTKVASASGVEISKSGMMSSQKNGE